MTIQETPTTRAQTQARQIESPVRARGGIRFDWAFTLACCWLIGGLHLDGWAHNHIPALETFFTPWHAVLYSGYDAIAAILIVTLVRNHARGHAWRRSLPPGYDVSLVGVALFALGGILDMVWHLLFGIERSVDALLSPTHLLLATSGVLMVTGPLRAAWRRLPHRSGLTWGTGLPALLSLTFVAAVPAFFTQFAHPFVDNLASANVDTGVVSPFFDQALGVASILLQTAILMGVVLLLVRRWAPPFEALALIFTLSTLLISFMHDHYPWIVLALVAGLIADILLRLLRPAAERPVALRVFAFAVPAILYGLYFLRDHHRRRGHRVVAAHVGRLSGHGRYRRRAPELPGGPAATALGRANGRLGGLRVPRSHE